MNFAKDFRGSENGDFCTTLIEKRAIFQLSSGFFRLEMKFLVNSRGLIENKTIFQLSRGSFQLGMNFPGGSIGDEKTAILVIELIENRTIFWFSGGFLLPFGEV